MSLFPCRAWKVAMEARGEVSEGGVRGDGGHQTSGTLVESVTIASYHSQGVVSASACHLRYTLSQGTGMKP